MVRLSEEGSLADHGRVCTMVSGRMYQKTYLQDFLGLCAGKIEWDMRIALGEGWDSVERSHRDESHPGVVFGLI